MRTIPFIILLTVLSGGVAAGQTRDDDLRLDTAFDVAVKLSSSLADSPLTSNGRDQIYRLIDGPDLHWLFTDRDEERKTMMSSRVGFVQLAEKGGPQIVVQGPASFGGTGGDYYWILTRQRGQWQLILDAFGGVLVQKTFSHGFHDLEIGNPLGAYEVVDTFYRWNGTKYEKVGCTETDWDRDNSDKPPVTTDCGTKPR